MANWTTMRTGRGIPGPSARRRAGGVLLLGASLAILAAAMPAAAERRAAGGGQLAQAASDPRAFSIPAGDLQAALLAFSQQAGLQLLYPADLTAGLSSNGAVGRLTPREALVRLLDGTGLIHDIAANGTVTLAKLPAGSGAAVLGPITVQGHAVPQQAEIGNLPAEYPGGQVARGGKLGMLGNRDILDTPFSQTSYTAELMENQQARTIADVVANDPSVRLSWPSHGYSNPLVIRGFAASNQDVAFDGLYGVAPTFAVDVGMAERVEVFKGPNALLTGMQPTGSVGGGINIVPKRAGDDPVTAVTASYASDSQLGTQFDVGRRFGDDKAFGVRLNGSISDGDTAVDDQSQSFGSAAVALDYQGGPLRLTLDAGYQQQNMNAPTLVTYVGAGVPLPDAPDASSNWYQPWGWVDISDTYGAARAEYDIGADWTLFAAAGGKETHWERLTYFPTVTNAAGDLLATPGHLKYRYLTDTEEAGVRGKLRTGPLGHELVASATRYRQRIYSASENVGGPASSNLYDPVASPRPSISDLDANKTGDNELGSLALADVVSVFGDDLQLIGGLRYQSIDTTNYNGGTGAVTSSYDDSVVSPTVGVVVKPVERVSLYANYIEGLQQGTVVGPSYANAGETLAPFVSKQWEAGIKVDWGALATTVSAFQITQPSGTAASATGVFSADGEQRNRGLELNVFGEVAEGIRVLGGATLMEATLTETANGSNDGNDAPGVPNVQVNLGGEWDLPFAEGLTLTGRAIYTGEQPLDNENTRTLPDWTRFDIGLRYAFETPAAPLVLRFNVENVLDNDYWASSAYYPGWVAPGAPRTFLLSMTAKF